jgi:DNA-binding GntR family transcriptional regulator
MTDNLTEIIDTLEEDIVFGRRRPRERLVEDDLVAQFGAKKHRYRRPASRHGFQSRGATE